ncbi:minor tail protein [Streptomyces phage Diane]|uniref:Minor tail protein n=1 Tax=Streptomyces phage Diane TaxID=2041207 RepID=A0A291LHD6_9CAUD|nr:minor tail protein [Streptomyces phage Diane]ATI18806.1 minor tail protein [Streptomyces phage Diane]
MGFSVIPEPAISGFTGPQGPAGTIPSDPVFNGSAGINDTTGDPNLDIKKNGSLRWKVRSAGTESGSNNGSDLWVEAFADDGTTKLSTPIWISRTIGQVVIGAPDSSQSGVKLSVADGIGVRSQSGDPATSTVGAQLYAKSGKLWVQTASGAEKFQVVESLPKNGNAQLNGQYLWLDTAAGTYRAFGYKTAGVDRWLMQVDDLAESGSNAGSNFRLSARNDDGSFNRTVVYARRDSGQISLGTTVLHGEAQVTSAGAIGLRDLGADPATATGGVYLYSKGGLPYIKQADGTVFQVGTGGGAGAVTSVNGQTGAVTLAAADVSAVPTSEKGAASGVATLDSNGKLPASQITTQPTFTDFMIINASTDTSYGIVALRKQLKKRWSFMVSGASETGSDAGSNFLLQSYTDAEADKTAHLYADRASGSTTIGSTQVMNGARLAVQGGAFGIVDQAADPTSSSLGAHFYSKGGKPYMKRSSAATGGSASSVFEVQPRPSEFLPEDLGLVAWTSDPMDCLSTGAFTGVTNARVAAVYLREPKTVSKIVWHFTGYAGGLLSGSWAAVYNSSGTRVGFNDSIHTGTNEPAEQHGLGGGASSVPITSTTLAAGLYYIVWRFNYTTSPADGPMCLQYENSAGGPPDVFGLNNVVRFGVLDATSQATSYTSLTVANIQRGGNRFWAALA